MWLNMQKQAWIKRDVAIAPVGRGSRNRSSILLFCGCLIGIGSQATEAKHVNFKNTYPFIGAVLEELMEGILSIGLNSGLSRIRGYSGEYRSWCQVPWSVMAFWSTPVL